MSVCFSKKKKRDPVTNGPNLKNLLWILGLTLQAEVRHVASIKIFSWITSGILRPRKFMLNIKKEHIPKCKLKRLTFQKRKKRKRIIRLKYRLSNVHGRNTI
jgi:hypothetical protein